MATDPESLRHLCSFWSSRKQEATGNNNSIKSMTERKVNSDKHVVHSCFKFPKGAFEHGTGWDNRSMNAAPSTNIETPASTNPHKYAELVKSHWHASSHTHTLFHFALSTDSYCEPQQEKAPWRATISRLVNKPITYNRPTPPLYFRYFRSVRPTQEGVLCKWRWRASDHLSSTLECRYSETKTQR